MNESAALHTPLLRMRPTPKTPKQRINPTRSTQVLQYQLRCNKMAQPLRRGQATRINPNNPNTTISKATL